MSPQMSQLKLAHKLFVTTASRLRMPSHKRFTTTQRNALKEQPSQFLNSKLDENDRHYMTWEKFSDHNTQYINRFVAVEKNVTGLQGAIGALSDSVNKLESKMDKGFENIDTRFNTMEDKLTAEFQKTDTQFRKVEERMDTRFSKMEEKMDTRFSKMEEKMDTRFNNLEAKFSEGFKNGRAEMKELSGKMDTGFNNLEAKFSEEFKNGRAEMKELNEKLSNLHGGQKKHEGMMLVGLQAMVLAAAALITKLGYDMYYREGGKKT